MAALCRPVRVLHRNCSNCRTAVSYPRGQLAADQRRAIHRTASRPTKFVSTCDVGTLRASAPVPSVPVNVSRLAVVPSHSEGVSTSCAREVLQDVLELLVVLDLRPTAVAALEDRIVDFLDITMQEEPKLRAAQAALMG